MLRRLTCPPPATEFSPSREFPSFSLMLAKMASVSGRRALPLQYFNVMVAWKARRSAPDIFELANFKSSICEALKDKRVGLVVVCMVVISGRNDEDSLP